MSWVTVIWSMDSAFCFVLAGIYLLVSLKQREWREHLLFSCSALAAGVVAGFELAEIRAETVTQYGALMRWAQLPLWIVLVSLVWFVHLYLRAGRRWLVWTFCGLRTLLLAANFLSKTSVVYREITSLRHFSWWGGETVSAPVGVPNPWVLVGQLSLLLLLIFFLDVTITVWRRGDRRRALMVGGSAVFFLTLLLGESVLVTWVIKSPFLISFAYLGIIATMGYELSDNLLRAAHLAKQFQASEAALRESEARIKLAANAANLGLWVWDIRNDEFLVTEKWRRLFGFAESEPVNFGRWLQLVHPEDRERMNQVVQDILEHGGGERESEYRITRPDGSTRWISGYGGVELDEGGKPAFTRGVSRDITKRKIAEEELRESEARFRTVADAAPVLIWMSGPDKLCTFFNKGWLDFTGRTMEQELGTGWAKGVHSDDLKHCLEIYGSSFDARQPFTMEYRLRRNDGEYRWVLDSGTPHFSDAGTFLGYIGSCIDITERKRAEEKFRIVLDAAPNAMIMVDSAGVISFANEPAATVFGYSLSELIGRPIETLIPERFRDRHAGYRKGFHSEPSSRAMGAGRDLFGRRKDATEFPVEVGLNPIHTTEGFFVLASVTDITARKQAELEHQLQNMELARVGRVAVMGELAASLAHEVNNPIGAIVANASAGQRLLAAGKMGTEELTELLADIVADGRRAGEVIQGIRNMVRKGEARRSLIPIGDQIRHLLRFLHADAVGRDVKVTAKVDPDAGQVWGDPVQLLQVLLNLALNAFEAMSVMRPDARRLVIRAGHDGTRDILVSLRDSGPGFPSGMAEQLFEPFFSTKADGVGMGLAISRSIIEAHGGTLSGENCDGGGACFTVRLPQAKEEDSQAT
ncbi:MAG TPA: PAS domain S-box protein [Bryobacteraceae bacterium]|nr:PAS domain S-box protein [Bryobacteraceae bacterium]